MNYTETLLNRKIVALKTLAYQKKKKHVVPLYLLPKLQAEEEGKHIWKRVNLQNPSISLLGSYTELLYARGEKDSSGLISHCPFANLHLPAQSLSLFLMPQASP